MIDFLKEFQGIDLFSIFSEIRMFIYILNIIDNIYIIFTNFFFNIVNLKKMIADKILNNIYYTNKYFNMIFI